MEYGAIDLHKKESQIRIVTESGEVIDQRRPGASRARCLRCGATRPTIDRRAFGQSDRRRTRRPSLVLSPSRGRAVRSSSWRSKRACNAGRT